MNKLRTLYKEYVPSSVGTITIPEYPMKCSSAQRTDLSYIKELEAEIDHIKSLYTDYHITSGRWKDDTITIDSKETVVIRRPKL